MIRELCVVFRNAVAAAAAAAAVVAEQTDWLMPKNQQIFFEDCVLPVCSPAAEA